LKKIEETEFDLLEEKMTQLEEEFFFWFQVQLL